MHEIEEIEAAQADADKLLEGPHSPQQKPTPERIIMARSLSVQMSPMQVLEIAEDKLWTDVTPIRAQTEAVAADPEGRKQERVEETKTRPRVNSKDKQRLASPVVPTAARKNSIKAELKDQDDDKLDIDLDDLKEVRWCVTFG